MNEIKEYTEKMFEDIKHIDLNWCEFWYARELQKVLEYKNWRNFNKVISLTEQKLRNENVKLDKEARLIMKLEMILGKQ